MADTAQSIATAIALAAARDVFREAVAALDDAHDRFARFQLEYDQLERFVDDAGRAWRHFEELFRDLLVRERAELAELANTGLEQLGRAVIAAEQAQREHTCVCGHCEHEHQFSDDNGAIAVGGCHVPHCGCDAFTSRAEASMH